ncbi:hypothetical protein ACFQGE_02095 [Halomicroarcula sp. GCM10025817]|uniref:hypothetical protein n=1 Tax=Haloarcula TaxID=2237 RepID=UPI0023E7DB93|nr:hypothetical protein [Halomicroarcula sp. SYNS111]
MDLGDAFDRALEAIGHEHRRQLLLALLDDPEPGSDTPLKAESVLGGTGSPSDEQSMQVLLAHVHLPKLESMGYIERGTERDAIHRGPNWDEVEPLLVLLRDHGDTLPSNWVSRRASD